MTAEDHDPTTGVDDPRPDGASSGDGASRSGSRAVASARGGATRVLTAVRGSVLYRWLTAEPEPDVIVIDLRETRTVGPVLRVLDRVVASVAAAAEGSRFVAAGRRVGDGVRDAPLRAAGLVAFAVGVVALVVGAGALGDPSAVRLGGGAVLCVVGVLGLRDDRDWETLRGTRPVELLRRAFEPPEPPGTDATGENTDATDAHDDPNTVGSHTDADTTEPRVSDR